MVKSVDILLISTAWRFTYTEQEEPDSSLE